MTEIAESFCGCYHSVEVLVWLSCKSDMLLSQVVGLFQSCGEIMGKDSWGHIPINSCLDWELAIRKNVVKEFCHLDFCGPRLNFTYK